ncbi:AAA family ATPase [Candidatus Woesearchaeota archaeon]|nr:AAA family ATPase [Candidatus Woesearchaeota archaeon]
MFIKRVELKNIRSYKHAELNLPEGLVLLSGDIGCGKSTVLLAIEFALFGLQRGELTGAALLRNGAQEGEVKLSFELEKKEYTILRKLKRTSSSVAQDAGYLEIDGKRTELTATELKSRILELFGYPSQLLTKKALVYRFTVYTPQENMKMILEQDREDRLKILRTVFDIDKYQRIKENASLYTKSLRDRMRLIEGQLLDLPEKRALKEKEESQLEQVRKDIKELTLQLEVATNKLNAQKAELKNCEDAKQKHEHHSRSVQVCRTKLDLEQRNMINLSEELKELSKSIASLEKELKPIEEINISAKETEMEQLESQINSLRTSHAEHAAKRKHAQDTAKKVSELDHCPLCLQDVSAEHKSKIFLEQKGILKHIYEKELELQKSIEAHQEKLAVLRNELQALRHKEKEAEVLKVRHAHFKSLKEKKEKQSALLVKTEEDIKKIQLEMRDHKQALEPLLELVGRYEEIKQKVDSISKEERNIEVQHAAADQKRESCEKHIGLLEDDINKKELAKLKLDKIKETNAWLSNTFLPLVDDMERHVMVKIHEDFDDTFKEWFSMLVDDNLMTARLDDSFSPIIQQNGYETETQFLSGGERTACALAYRLALNNTVNNLLNTIKTKNLLILDEPTDGFSADQLDKMRDVLEQLQLRQIIIVSHEQKIESFAEKTIRIEKHDHTSSAISV